MKSMLLSFLKKCPDTSSEAILLFTLQYFDDKCFNSVSNDYRDLLISIFSSSSRDEILDSTELLIEFVDNKKFEISGRLKDLECLKVNRIVSDTMSILTDSSKELILKYSKILEIEKFFHGLKSEKYVEKYKQIENVKKIDEASFLEKVDIIYHAEAKEIIRDIHLIQDKLNLYGKNLERSPEILYEFSLRWGQAMHLLNSYRKNSDINLQNNVVSELQGNKEFKSQHIPNSNNDNNPPQRTRMDDVD